MSALSSLAPRSMRAAMTILLPPSNAPPGSFPCLSWPSVRDPAGFGPEKPIPTAGSLYRSSIERKNSSLDARLVRGGPVLFAHPKVKKRRPSRHPTVRSAPAAGCGLSGGTGGDRLVGDRRYTGRERLGPNNGVRGTVPSGGSGQAVPVDLGVGRQRTLRWTPLSRQNPRVNKQ